MRLMDKQFSVNDWDTVWALLYTIVSRKCSRYRRFHHAQKRNVLREESLDEAVDGDGPARGEVKVDGGLQTGEDDLIWWETFEDVTQGLDETSLQIVCLSIEGRRPAEISESLSCSLAKVRRALKRIRERLQNMQAMD